jgi:phosphatidylglycerol---prolipoprotein diacylglyceryl transferase
MYPQLLHIYGPIFLQSYGVCIALGIALYGFLLFKDKKRRVLVDDEEFHKFVTIGIVSGIIGGRLLYCLTAGPCSFIEFFEFWQGGFAVLGSLIGVLCVIPLVLYFYKASVLACLDRAALYAPLLQAISRIGCFLAGCCFGKPTFIPWAITYTDPTCRAPLDVLLHPVQLYSAGMLVLIFCLLYGMQSWLKKDGQLLGVYVLLMAFERFFIDFFRDDQTYSLERIPFFSDQQHIAFLLMFAALFFLIVRSRQFFAVKKS